MIVEDGEPERGVADECGHAVRADHSEVGPSPDECGSASVQDARRHESSGPPGWAGRSDAEIRDFLRIGEEAAARKVPGCDAQRAAAEALEGLPSDHPKPEAFMRQAARNKAIDEERRQSPQGQRIGWIEDPRSRLPERPEDMDPARYVEARQRLMALYQDAALTWNPDQYEVLQWFVAYGGNVGEAVTEYAREKGISVATARQRFDRVRATMRRKDTHDD